MKNISSIVSTVKNVFVFALIIIIPLFFLPITQEYYITNKLYLLAFAGLALFLFSGIELLTSKKIVWQKRVFDNVFFLFLVTIGLSVLLVSPNKIQALLNPNFGLVAMIALFIFYYYLSRSVQITNKINLITIINCLGLLVAFLSIAFLPIKNINFPPNLIFLKNAGFTPLGIQIDLAIFLGFFVIFSLNQILMNRSNKKDLIFNSVLLVLNAIALSITVYLLIKSVDGLILPPLKLSWFAAVETLKNPLNALFGIGVDNFSSMFSRIKDIAYNQSTLWQIQSFTVSRSTILHILTETGVFGLLAFTLLLLTLIKQVVTQNKSLLLTTGYLLLVLFFLPPSFITFFLLVIFLAYTANQLPASQLNHPLSTFDLTNIMPLYIGLPVVILAIVGAAGFFLSKSYQAELLYKRALDGYASNNLKNLYDNQRQAILVNPNIEKYRVNFAQTNLLIANNIINQAIQSNKDKGSTDKVEINAQDQQTISQAIQAAISEAKAAVALNPQKAGNWENLGIIYRNIMNLVQGQADAWTVSSYQQAIGLDPQNPSYRLNLGGIYYSLNIFDEAIKMFEQSVALKPDWPNAYYNLAWALFQKADYQKAALNMQNVLYLLDPKKEKADYDKALQDLEEIKKNIPVTEPTPTPVVQEQQKQQLTLPTPAQEIEPPIELPKEASPEAR